MPRKGPWVPPKYVGPPIDRDAAPPPKLTNCSTCFDLDMRYIPQPHRDPDSSTYAQVARHWILSTNLAKDPTCKTCSFLKSAFDTLVNSADLVGTPPRGMTYSIAILDRDDGYGADAATLKTKREAAGRSGASRSLHVEMRCNFDGGDNEEFQVEIYTPPGGAPAPWKAIGLGGDVPTQPSGTDSAVIIKPWLDHCDQNHSLCQTDRTPGSQGELLPRRVLDLSGGQIRLIETQGRRGRYVALSHCWGKEQLLTTTRGTIAERMLGITMQQLPRTFQDAVTITRGLGLQYIWIDSLCIIQKDAEDWEQQSAVMADIYANCYLNIATTRASGGNEGCLGPRWTSRDSLRWLERFSKESHRGTGNRTKISKIRKSNVRAFKVPGMAQDIYIRLSLESSHEAMQTERWVNLHKETSPLLQRGWVHQERFLSPRSVHIHANEMTWVCKVEQRCECRTLDGRPPAGDGWSVSKDRIATLHTLGDRKALHGLWRSIIEDFTLLDLTEEYDRLPAVSGLASKFAEYFPNERYLAGLWEDDLARDLLWESGGGSRTKGPIRKREPNAPSWSWTCLGWGKGESGADWEYETKPKLANWAPTTSFKQDNRVRIIDASVRVKGQNPYGIVTSGSIVIEGAMCGIIVGSFRSLHLDYDTSSLATSAGGTIYCLFIGSFIDVNDHDKEPHIRNSGLILKPVSGGKFERIGRWTQFIEDWTSNGDLWTRQARVFKVEII
ncbi:heterokaryon incompatibility protein-domain-containing protein [Collybia nuda]|uniref:Heterokaryon incompatibility protein-domain-containing protein n=1 Tax=Collybia nuda TaxID=64659 RepID=A0A9P5YJ14_9AGAR|nr:heterokaryon incompatibility protein-domain-containing protein [Collybia nuda]